MALKFFTPYIEAPSVRVSVEQVTYVSGSDVSAIADFRQGIEVKNKFQRNTSILPYFGTDSDIHEIEIITVGQQDEFNQETLFEEILKFDPVIYINNNDVQMFPVVMSNASYKDREPEFLGGYIEPLSIGPRDWLTTNANVAANQIRSTLMCGNEDTFGKVDSVVTIFEHDTTQLLSFYEDFPSVDALLATLFVQNAQSFDENVIIPFADMNSNKSMHNDIIIELSGSIAETILNMSGGSTESYLVGKQLSNCTGFMYALTYLGTDSIAFSGLKNS